MAVVLCMRLCTDSMKQLHNACKFVQLPSRVYSLVHCCLDGVCCRPPRCLTKTLAPAFAQGVQRWAQPPQLPTGEGGSLKWDELTQRLKEHIQWVAVTPDGRQVRQCTTMLAPDAWQRAGILV